LAHRGNLLKEYLEKEWTQDKLGDIRLEYLIQDSIGTADAVKKCRENIDSEKFIVSMGDIVTNLPMKNIMQFHSEKKGISTISMKTVESHTSQYGVVLLDKNRKIYLFLEKPLPMELYVSGMAQRTDLFLHTNIINTGIYAFDTKILDILESHPLVDFGGDVFPYLLANNYDLYGFVEKYYASADKNLKDIIEQLGRELLLLESSDWQFLISTWTARDYSENRIAEHYEKFIRLYDMAVKYGKNEMVDEGEWEYLGMVKDSDSIFEKLDANAFKPFKYD
ncbi:unnamed protein product, partial [marine sediment metagenome]